MEKKYKHNNFVRKRVKNKCQVNIIVLQKIICTHP